VMSKVVSMKRGVEGMAGFDQVLIDSGVAPDDFLAALHAEMAEGFQLKAAPGSVHTFRGLIMPGIVRAGLVSERVRPHYEAAGIKLFADTSVLEGLENSGDVGPAAPVGVSN